MKYDKEYVDEFNKNQKYVQDKITQLESKLKIATDTLELYADELNYGAGNYTWLVRHGWEKAREALQQITA